MAEDDRSGSEPVRPEGTAGRGDAAPQSGYPPQPGYPPQQAWGPPPGPGFVQPYGTPGRMAGTPTPPYPPGGWPYPTGFGFVPYVPAGPAPGVGWAGIGVRFAALLIDIVLMIVTYFGVVAVVEAAGLGRYVHGSYVYSQTATALVLVWLAFAIAYHPLCWYFSGRSLGQKALGLRVVRASDGLKLGLGAVLIRYIIFIITTGTVLPGIIAAGAAARDPFKRAWHDMVARSVVVKWP